MNGGLLMLNNKHNFNSSELPKIGDIVTVQMRELQSNQRYERFIVESYNLCDNILPYSKGIHLVNLTRLKDNAKFQVSGHWCVVE